MDTEKKQKVPFLTPLSEARKIVPKEGIEEKKNVLKKGLEEFCKKIDEIFISRRGL